MFWFEEPGQNSRQDTPRDETIVPGNHNDIEKRLWSAADELKVNFKLKCTQYSLQVQGLIFLEFADFGFRQAEQEERAESIYAKTGHIIVTDNRDLEMS